jgi:hypothetical protein
LKTPYFKDDVICEREARFSKNKYFVFTACINSAEFDRYGQYLLVNKNDYGNIKKCMTCEYLKGKENRLELSIGRNKSPERWRMFVRRGC